LTTIGTSGHRKKKRAEKPKGMEEEGKLKSIARSRKVTCGGGKLTRKNEQSLIAAW